MVDERKFPGRSINRGNPGIRLLFHRFRNAGPGMQYDRFQGGVFHEEENLLLREAGLKKGWSQQQSADFAGLSRSTIERAERGEPLRIDSIQLLCECLNRTPEELGLVKMEHRKEEKDWVALTDLTNHLNTSGLWDDAIFPVG